MNVVAQLEFELAYYVVTIQHISYYATEILQIPESYRFLIHLNE